MSKSGTIYKLCCNDTDITEEYVGSTKNFNRRRSAHKSVCNNEKNIHYNCYVYQFIRENEGWDNWRMIQLEAVNYETRRDLEAHERRWIELLKPKLNKQIPTRTIQEWYQDNKENINEKHKEYYNDNKENIKEKHKEYYNDNKENIKEKHKEYYNDNKENINEKKKEYNEINKEKRNNENRVYYQKNKNKKKEYYIQYKDKIKEYRKQKIKCIYCDIELRKDSLHKHNKSGRHIYNYIHY